jgi:hypothetical protein
MIFDTTGENQTKVVICSAFNGWLYAAYEFYTTKWGGHEAFELLKSVDDGITWVVIFGGAYAHSDPFSSFDIAVIGDSISNIKVFLSWVQPGGGPAPGDDGGGEVWRFDGNGNFLDGIDLNASYLALANDFMYPAINSNPCSISVIYASNYSPNYSKDTLYLLTSSNGGLSYDNRQVIAVNSNHFHDVALAYGRSPSWSTGRYFAVWTETNDYTTYTGHIYTAHSNPDFNSPFTKPVCIDSLDPSAINKCRKPKIACQFSGSDNDSSNLSEVIMLEKQLTSGSYDTRGFYNLQATTSSHFNEFSLSSSSNNKTQPDINFNPYNSTFMLTYYDSTIQSLPFLTNNVNLPNPVTWNIVSQAYNDSPNLAAPYPKVALDMGQQQGADVWIKEGTGGNGVAMFDAPYSTYTGDSEITGSLDKSIRVYPNPAKDKFEVRCAKCDIKSIEIFNLTGEKVYGAEFPGGTGDVVEINLDFPAGVYFVRVMSEKGVEVGKIMKN